MEEKNLEEKVVGSVSCCVTKKRDDPPHVVVVSGSGKEQSYVNLGGKKTSLDMYKNVRTSRVVAVRRKITRSDLLIILL